VALRITRHQNQEGGDEVPEQQHEADADPPVVGLARKVPDGFLGDVAVPDEHVLAEGDVGPEDHEAEGELADVVKVLDR
jgi:hypothetical protein